MYNIIDTESYGKYIGDSELHGKFLNFSATSAFNLVHEHLSPPIQIFPKTEHEVYVIVDPIVEYPLEMILGDNQTGELTEKKIIKIIKQLLDVLKFLHKNGQIALLDGGRIDPVCEIKDSWV